MREKLPLSSPFVDDDLNLDEIGTTRAAPFDDTVQQGSPTRAIYIRELQFFQESIITEVTIFIPKILTRKNFGRTSDFVVLMWRCPTGFFLRFRFPVLIFFFMFDFLFYVLFFFLLLFPRFVSFFFSSVSPSSVSPHSASFTFFVTLGLPSPNNVNSLDFFFPFLFFFFLIFQYLFVLICFVLL